jgi:transcriptional regulator with XRE-family HTH domain
MERMTDHNFLACRVEKFATRKEPFHFTDSGLPNIYLVGIRYFVCEGGEVVAEIPAIKQLMQLIARDLVTSPLDLTGEEIKFLRKRLGQKASEFSQYLGVTPETLSRVENGKQAVSRQMQVLARLSFCIFSEEPTLLERAKSILQSMIEEIKKRRKKQRVILEMDSNQEWRELKAA